MRKRVSPHKALCAELLACQSSLCCCQSNQPDTHGASFHSSISAETQDKDMGTRVSLYQNKPLKA